MNLPKRFCCTLIALGFLIVNNKTADAASPEGSGKPFSQLAVGVALGTQGVGFQVGTNLIPHLSLRGGGDFLHVSTNFDNDGKTYDGKLALGSGQISVDWNPFPWGGFRISPGVMLYNGTNVNAAMSVAAGQTFNLNHVTYFSSTSDPVTGTVKATFPKAGPQLTIGFGNLIPKKRSKHFVSTFDLGFAYFGTGSVTDVYAGSACTFSATSGCKSAATDPSILANVAAEQESIQKNMKYARFYPILKVGFGWHF